MKIRYLFISFIVILFFPLATLAQSNSGGNEKDPFKNDPFFSKPLDELLGNKPYSQSEKSSDSTYSINVKHYLGRINVEGVDYGGAFEAGPYSSNALYALYPTLPMIHFNRVDGLFLGIREERMQWYGYDNWLDLPGINNFHPTGMIGYSFGQEEWQYELGLERYLGLRRRIIIGAEIHRATSTDDYWRMGQTETSLTSFFAGYDYLDYYKQQGWGTYLLLRSRRLFEGGISYNDDRFTSLDRNTDYALFGSHGRYRDNPPVEFRNGLPVDTVSVSSLSFSAAFNPKQLIIAPHFTVSVSGTMEIGDPGYTNSDYSYTKYTGELISYINFEPGGVLKYRLMAGSITGNAPYLKEFQLGGPGSLRAMPYKSLPFGSPSGNKMILSNAEIHFGSSNYKSGWINFDDIYFSMFLDSGWVTNYRKENRTVLDGFSGFSFSDLEHNGGLGVGTSLLRVELAWDLNHTSREPMLWIRLNPTF